MSASPPRRCAAATFCRINTYPSHVHLGDGGVKPHCEVARGTPQQNKAYCTKSNTSMPYADYVVYARSVGVNEENVWKNVTVEFGKLKKGQGRRSDLDSFVGELQDGRSLDQVILDNPSPYIKYSTGLSKYSFYLNMEASKKWRDVTVDVLWGSTGVGKTRQALQTAEDNAGDWFMMRKDEGKTMWYDGYSDQKTLVMDEYHGNWMQYKTLLGVLDGHPYRLPTKGAHVWAQWTHVILTSSTGPHGWYSRDEYSELDRRITNVTHLDPLRAAMPPQPLMRRNAMCNFIIPDDEVHEEVLAEGKNHSDHFMSPLVNIGEISKVGVILAPPSLEMTQANPQAELQDLMCFEEMCDKWVNRPHFNKKQGLASVSAIHEWDSEEEDNLDT